MFDFCNFNYIIEYKSPKYVKFNNIVQVYLIPSIKDYTKNNLKDKIWYSDDDYKFFKNNNLLILIK